MLYPSKISYCKSKCSRAYPCCTLDYYAIDETLYYGKVYFNELLNDIWLKYTTGIGTIVLDTYNKLKHYLKALEYEMTLLYFNTKSCLSNPSLCRLIEKTKSLIPIRCFRGMRMDKLKTSTHNPLSVCKSFESWNRLTVGLCLAMNLDIQVMESPQGQACNKLAMTLITDVDLLNMGQLMSRMPYCNTKYSMDIKELKCTQKYKMEIATKCHLEYDMVAKLISCGITPEFIMEAVKCDYDFSIVHKDQCIQSIQLISENNTCESDMTLENKDVCVLMHKMDNIINLCDIKFIDELNLERCLELLN